MNLLKEGINNKIVIKTDRATKLTVDGISETYPIYRVRLDNLFYNDQNDRIATWISQYKADNNVDELDKTNINTYNDIIQDFIIKSNSDKINSTKKNIEFIGQQKYGVVLTDGRIIDGNRRFTCLRQLAKTNPQFNYFDTVILDRDYENSKKQIKMLELQIQIGEEARVDYNPIDRLVGIYNDIIERKLLSVHEYAMSTGMQSDKDVEKLVQLSELLVEFLEAINAPKQFYLARDLDLDGPLVELQSILKKIKDEEEKEEIKYIAFTNFLMKPSKDMTRFIRKLKGVTTSPYIKEFIEKELDIAESVLDRLPEEGKVNNDTIDKIKSDRVTSQKLEDIMELFDNKVKITEVKNKPEQFITKAVDLMEGIDQYILKKLSEEQCENIIEQLDKLEEIIKNIRGMMDV